MSDFDKRAMLKVSSILFGNNVPVEEAKIIGFYIEQLQQQRDLYKSVIDEIDEQIKYYTETTSSEYSDASLIVDLKIILDKANIKED